MTQVIHGQRPPNYEAIQKVFPMASGLGVIFAYGDKIYTLSRLELPAHLLAHEEVHCTRQLRIGTEAWWDRYLTDIDFVRYEEILAHRAEYEALARHGSRQQRRRALIDVAKSCPPPCMGP